MAHHRGYYSLIQYCPDPSRAEVANVGVLLFCPALEYLDARIARGNDRVRRFFGPDGVRMDLKALRRSKEALVGRVQSLRSEVRSVEGLERFVQSRGNDLVLTHPRPTKVEHPESTIEQLFQELVGTRVSAKGPHQTPLSQALREDAVAKLVIFDRQVEVPVLDQTVIFPYSYRNGRTHLISEERFGKPRPALARASYLSVVSDLLSRHKKSLAEEFRLIVVPVIDGGQLIDEDLQAHLEEVLREYDVEYVRPEGTDLLVNRIKSQAH